MLYARTFLAADDDAEAAFRNALSHDLTLLPFVWARLQLAFGECT